VPPRCECVGNLKFSVRTAPIVRFVLDKRQPTPGTHERGDVGNEGGHVRELPGVARGFAGRCSEQFGVEIRMSVSAR
jgi:hypothetical protein